MSWLTAIRHGHFSPNDGGLHDPDGTLIDERLMVLLDEAREQAGVPFIVTSGLRPPAANAAAGGAVDSAHLPDNRTRQACAVDGFFQGWSLFRQFVYLVQFPFFGIGLYPYAPPGRDPARPWTPTIHVDRKDRERPYKMQLFWVRDRRGQYVYSTSLEFYQELELVAAGSKA